MIIVFIICWVLHLRGKVTRWGDINISVVEVDWDIESIASFYNLFYSSFVLDEGVER